MSLTEYKKRMKQKRPETSRGSSSSGRSSSNNSGHTTPTPKENSNHDLLAPLMPYFGTLGSSLNKDKGLSLIWKHAITQRNLPSFASFISYQHFQYFGSFNPCRSFPCVVSILPAAALPSLKDPKDEADIHWNASATMAERIREQTQLSLTERLRREFGLDASESDDEDDKKKGMSSFNVSLMMVN